MFQSVEQLMLNVSYCQFWLSCSQQDVLTNENINNLFFFNLFIFRIPSIRKNLTLILNNWLQTALKWIKNCKRNINLKLEKSVSEVGYIDQKYGSCFLHKSIKENEIFFMKEHTVWKIFIKNVNAKSFSFSTSFTPYVNIISLVCVTVYNSYIFKK